MKPLPILITLLALGFFVVTLLTQVGGFLLLFGGLLGFFLFSRRRKVMSFLFAIIVYTSGLLIIPLIAKPLGRQPLPWQATSELPIQPRNIGYCLLFRNYVSEDLVKVLTQVSSSYNEQYPNEPLDYLDACFPFVDGFPLLPHLSHDDGNKIDLCFGYTNTNGKYCQSPSPIGYWIYEPPKKNEYQPCGKSALRWNFNGLQKINRHRHFDLERTRELVTLFSDHQQVEKLFIEPHLKQRIKNLSDKIRFQGCRAARHDDHIHVQIYE